MKYKAISAFLNNVSVTNSSGVFRDNSSYSVSVGGEIIGTLTSPKNTTFSQDNSEIKIIFKDSNYTSNKYFVRNSQGSFLNFGPVN